MEHNYEVEIRQRLPHVTLMQHVEADGTLWGTGKRWILRKRPQDTAWQRVAKFPRLLPKDCFLWNRVATRITRADKANVFVNRQGSALAIRGGTVYRIDLPQQQLQPLAKIQGDCTLHRGICESSDGTIYFGEYFRNQQRGPVRIWRAAPDLSSIEVAYQFDSNSIRHVHAVHRDPFDEQALWVTTGDYRDECYFFRTDDHFRSLQRFGDGTQIWRAVALYFTEDSVSWLTDSHIEQNHACRMNRSTGKLELGQQIDCSAWFGATTEDQLHIAFTTVESGPAISRNESSILISSDAFHWQEVAQFKKDFWKPYIIFKNGSISCPSGHLNLNEFYISGEALKGFDGISQKLCFTPKASAPELSHRAA